MSQVTKITVVLLLLLAGALVAAQAAESTATAPAAAVKAPATPEASDWFHNPEPWLEMGADVRFREHYGYNWSALNSNKLGGKNGDAEDHKFHFERYRSRWWTTSKLDEDTTINTRFTWEFRTWDNPASMEQSTDFDEIIMDNLNFKQKNFLGFPTTVTVGRQDIMNLGQGWLVLDGTPFDGSRTFYFDALRFTWDLGNKTTLDTIYIHNRPESDWWLKPINDRNKYVTQEEEDGVVIYYTNKSSPTQVEGYFMYKNNEPVEGRVVDNFIFPQPAADAASKEAEIYTFGGALSAPINDNWNYRVEGAIQTGRSESPNPAVTPNDKEEELLAFGAKGDLQYSFKDELNNRLHVVYEYLSGDDPGSDKVTSFNPLWGQWPQWSEMYQPYVTKLEDNLVSNLHRLAFGHKIKPSDQWEILTDYHLLWADENTFEGNSKFGDSLFRGQLLTCWARYTFTKQLKGNLVFEYMIPGDYYGPDNSDNALYFHWTVEYTF
jgi:hypothetical protein